MALRKTRILLFVLTLTGLMLASSCSSNYARVDSDVPHTAKPFAAKAQNFQFVIVGDRTGGHRPGVFNHAIERINQMQPEFVVGVGDLIEGYKDDEAELEKEWNEFDAIVDRLDMPFFYTVGNHDIGNKAMQSIWQQRYGRRYYHFIYHNVLFISLDTEDPPIALSAETLARQAWLEEMMLKDPEKVRRLLQERRQESGDGAGPTKLPGEVAISETQQTWLGNVLDDHPDVRWTILIMHKPAWQYDSPAFEHIEQLLEDRPYTVIAGHEHYFNYTSRNERDYVTMATTGGIWLSAGAGAFDHIAWVTMTDKGPIISNIALCGLLGTPQQTADITSSENVSEFCLQAAKTSE